MFNHLQQPNLPNLSTVSMNGKRYYITPSGKYYPSVTTVVNILNEKGIAEWRNKVGDYQANIISSQAANLGSRIHSIIEKYINNESDILDTATPQEKLMFGSVYSSLNRINNIYCQEAPLYSDLLKMAGRTDCIAEFDGIPSIIDFKTSRKDKKEEYIKSYFLQGTSYSIMFEELTKIKIPQIVIIVVTYEGNINIFRKNRKDYFEPLKNIINEYYKREKYATKE